MLFAKILHFCVVSGRPGGHRRSEALRQNEPVPEMFPAIEPETNELRAAPNPCLLEEGVADFIEAPAHVLAVVGQHFRHSAPILVTVGPDKTNPERRRLQAIIIFMGVASVAAKFQMRTPIDHND